MRLVKASGSPGTGEAPISGPHFANVPSTLLLVSTASLTEFGRVCGLPVPADRFRANLEVDINPPFAEMEWPLGSGVQVGRVAFEAAGHCVRCQAVDVDPEAGSASKPSLLSALATMQQSDGKGPTFGVLVRATEMAQEIASQELPMLKVGDAVCTR
uniref:MOSC domain-containing protein n=1 Tax=Noctiluca scintillans TaxID=2966 RepID=A0A7S1A1S0_NOCSC